MADQAKLKLSIIGRPNVGKSTLVNRLARKRVCIVGEQAGITRDRNYIDFDWEGRDITIIDTGGLTFDGQDNFAEEIKRQVFLALNEADALLFIVDVTTGITNEDTQIAEVLRKECDKPVYLAVNKVDSPEREPYIHEFYALGVKNLYPISALHGSHGLSQMLSDIIEYFNVNETIVDREEAIRVSIVGKPNVGKSSLFNKLVGEDRAIVSDVSGTTRDSVNTKLKRHGNLFELVDTAGLRRKSKVHEDVEKYSTIRSTFAIAASDVSVLVIDCTEDNPISDQDQKIASLIVSKGKPCIILVNKWDAFDAEIKNDVVKLEKFKDSLNYELRFISYAPVEFISAETGKRTDKIWQMIEEAYQESQKRISTSMLNKVLADILMFNPPPVVKQKAIKIKFLNQSEVGPPRFTFFVNHPELISDSYKKFLENQLRTYFGFRATPIFIHFKKSGES